MSDSHFRTALGESIFNQKYAHEGARTWPALAELVVQDVCRHHMTIDEKAELIRLITEMKFIPGGRYLYYAGRKSKFFNNCFLLRAEEDSRADWAELSWKAERCLMTGGGIGIDYSVYRPKGSRLSSTGGFASGPIDKMKMVNEIGRYVMQGGSRRSALYASLDWNHGDILDFMSSKNWHGMEVKGTDKTVWDLKQADFDYHAPLDMTNISVNYDDAWIRDSSQKGFAVFHENVYQAMKTGEPGFSFNFGRHSGETLRNACTEVTSSDDSDVCSLGTLNLSRFDSTQEFMDAIELATKFLICGSMIADLPYEKVGEVRSKNRRLGLGLMGVHEWLLKRGYKYEMSPELRRWLELYETISRSTAKKFSNHLGISSPIAQRAIAPTGTIGILAGTIGILAGTTTGIEPLYAVAYKRRYLKDKRWRYQYVIDGTAELLIREYDLKPDDIESAIDLGRDPERRIRFQADVQRYVDQGISSTLNLPAWGTAWNNEDRVENMAKIVAKYAQRLRGLTFYPDGARGGQPLTAVPYHEAYNTRGVEFEEHDICSISGKGGTCGV